MTLEEFVRNNRGINERIVVEEGRERKVPEDVPRNLLTAIYTNIQVQNPCQVSQFEPSPCSFMPCQRCGFRADATLIMIKCHASAYVTEIRVALVALVQANEIKLDEHVLPGAKASKAPEAWERDMIYASKSRADYIRWDEARGIDSACNSCLDVVILVGSFTYTLYNYTVVFA